MHQLSPHSTIAQLEVGGLLGNGVVVVEDSEGSLVLLQLRAGTSLPTSAQRLEAAGHRHDLCVHQEVPGDTKRFTHQIPASLLAWPSPWNPHCGPSLAWGRLGPGDWGPRPSSLVGPHMCRGQWTGVPTGPGVTNCTPTDPPPSWTGPRGVGAQDASGSHTCPKHPTAHTPYLHTPPPVPFLHLYPLRTLFTACNSWFPAHDEDSQ